MSTADPIDSYVAALERALRGPRRARWCMVAEARTGLRDAAAAYRAGGLSPEQAAERAVRDFGPVSEIAPLFQDELVAARGRWSAALLAVVFPAMLLGWDLLWSSGAVSREPAPAQDLVASLAALQDVLTAVVALVALALLVVTLRRTVPPRPLASVVGVTGTVGALVCGGNAVAMNVAGGQSTLTLLATNPTACAAFAGSAAVLVLLVWQSVRTLRVARTAAPLG
ncbi:permease prefix domain 1-containing protein [Actinophytocola xanthii]|uniref:Uncharacterized protein n=1 Tax=Actinophytocola xanthii TaxID=1912961 RepID=A0A1Q8CVN9_9PSEU|nr:permease prefix domain 1-containing protein [Actinophytocola xanthii]OLF18419.1 hypothetical protein BU204_05460 [Actinophytocola xanthii]